ncbi:MAG: argininosuccinate lyase [Candidatus Micrarchaeota archaeon]|nr:argininosuccinate lyase [Candidatus Micrarchaeota archaeon]MDE1849278.1 argininosuccinate lyase [Candidatus Micrarchaeota archaeon]
MKLWDKGYGIDRGIEEFTTGNDYILDRKLLKYDCKASIAHAKMLGKIGVLSDAEVKKLVSGLNQIIELDKKGKFEIKKEDEDCHTAIENYLTSKLGAVGKKIHTARSRNDQVAVALRLYYKDELKTCQTLASAFIKSLKAFSKKYGNIVMPGYTHTRKAMPSSAGMWTAAFIESMEDNVKQLKDVYSLIDQSPLGTGAGYGVPMKVDRQFTAKELGFAKVQESPIYVQNSRGKFEAAIVHALSMLMLDLNKMSQDLIMFSMPEFGYFIMPKEFTTGSSMMPHKRNPDALELLRASYHVVNSYEFQIKGIVSNLISGYNKDFQLTKEPTMKSFEIAEQSMVIASTLMNGIKVDKEACKKAMTEELFATQQAYLLVKKGVPFRDAYKKVGKKY